jgi:hypothetical protein
VPVSSLILAVTPSPSPTTTEIDPARVTPGVLGFVALLFLAVATFLLWRNMNKQLKKVDFDESAPID